MKTPKNTKISPHKKGVKKFKLWVLSEIKKNNRIKKNRRISDTPKFYFTAHNSSKKIILNYLIPKLDTSVKKKDGVRMVKKQKYLSNWSLDNYKTSDFSVLKWYDFVCEEVERYQKECFIDEGSLEHWIKIYTSPKPRRGIKKIPSPKTRRNELRYLNDYKDWLKENKPKYLNIWACNDDSVRDVFLDYLRSRAEKSEKKEKGWSDSTIFNSYRILRSLFNWISMKEPNFKSNRLSNMPIDKPKPILNSFSHMEIQKVLEFMDEHKEDNVWSWFIPILRLMLVSGCRVSEVANMKINELRFYTDKDVTKIEWKFKGKGNKERVIHIDSSTCLSDIVDAITDKKENLRTDKEYVFHKKFWKGGNRFGQGMGLVENLDEPFTISGIEHKFKKMVSLLKLNPKLTPHSTRRYFITEQLINSGGNIPFVALLVGHSSFEMVNHYQKHNQQSEMLMGQRNTLDFGEVIKRKKGIKYDKSK